MTATSLDTPARTAARPPAACRAVGAIGFASAPCSCSPSPRWCCRTSGSGLLAKYLCIAMVAVGIGLAWGRGGLLTLGQGVFFGLGGYAMAMHLKLADAGPGNLPDFMQLYGQLDELPWWWRPFASPLRSRSPPTVLLPMAVAVAARLAHLPPPGQGRVLRDPQPGARRRASRSC